MRAVTLALAFVFWVPLRVGWSSWRFARRSFRRGPATKPLGPVPYSSDNPPFSLLLGAVCGRLLAGEEVECNVCGGRFSRWYRRLQWDRQCGQCLSWGRHRVLVLAVDELDLAHAMQGKKVCHFAPEPGLSRRLAKTLSESEYIKADFASREADYFYDLTQLDLPDESVGAFFLSHIMEHIPDDRRAMREVYRVLEPGGFAFIMVPLDGRDETDEDSTVTDRAERVRRFGGHDHVRFYARDDLAARLRETGFEVDIRHPGESMTDEEHERSGIIGRDTVFVCRKPLEAPAPTSSS